MGEGGIKNGQNNSDVFYGRPLSGQILALSLEQLKTFIIESKLLTSYLSMLIVFSVPVLRDIPLLSTAAKAWSSL